MKIENTWLKEVLFEVVMLVNEVKIDLETPKDP